MKQKMQFKVNGNDQVDQKQFADLEWVEIKGDFSIGKIYNHKGEEIKSDEEWDVCPCCGH